MAQAAREYYFRLRQRFEPDPVRLILVAESPPVSGRYFYDPSGRVTEPLFAALMRQLGCAPETKECGLRAFQRHGWVLVDATYEPVNALTGTERDRVILRDYPLLQRDIQNLSRGRPVPVVLIKSNVCRLLETRLSRDGLNVVNGGTPVYFPSNGWQGAFARQFSAVVGL